MRYNILKPKFFCLLTCLCLFFYPSFPQPVVSSVAPASAPAGSTVIISGSGFGLTPSDNVVQFGGAKAPVLSASPSSLSVTVPTGFTNSGLTVTANNRIAFSPLPFTVSFPGGGAFTSGSFLPKTDVTATGLPQAIAVCDLDGDNKPELISANYAENTLSVYKNKSAGSTPAFAAKIDFATGIAPVCLAAGDIDGDGLNDLVTGNIGSNDISVLRNTTTGGVISFAAKVDLPASSPTNLLTLAELTGDGRPEIVVANSGGGILILRNNSSAGAPAFDKYVNFAAGPAATGIAVADFNGDGKADLATCNNAANQICILKNTGIGNSLSFTAPQYFPTANGPLSISTGDLDGDARADVVTANGNGSVSVLKNASNGGAVVFDPRLDLAVGHSSPRDVIVADFTGDGKPDIACGNNNVSATVSLFRNTSATGLSFDPGFDLISSAGPWRIVAGDLTADGRLDLAVAHSISNVLTVFVSKIGDAPSVSSFTPVSGGQASPVTINGTNLAGVTGVSFGSSPASSFTVVSDTRLTAVVGGGASGDVTVTTPAGSAVKPGFVFSPLPSVSSISPLNGSVDQPVKIRGNNFSLTAAYNTVYFGKALATVVKASDSVLTVKVPTAATYDPVSVTVNNLTARSKKPFTLTFANGSLSAAAFLKKIDIFNDYYDGFTNVVLADVDGDGKSDVLLNSYPLNCFWVYRNTSANGVISFAPRVKFSITGNHPYTLNTGDFDGDGKTDVVVGNDWSHTINLFRNTSTPGSVSFTAPKLYGVGQYPMHIAVGDLDGDGKLDLAVANESSTFVSLIRNISSPGDIVFAAQQTYPTSKTHNGSTHIGDIDGDGKPDVIICNGTDSSFSVFRNTSAIGTISVAPRLDFAAGLTNGFVTLGDLDGDGKDDAIVSKGYYNGTGGAQNIISVYRNTSVPGTVQFAAGKDYTAGIPSNVVLNDLDGDGKPDLVSSNGTNKVYFFRNKSVAGTVDLEAAVYIDVGYASNPNSVAIGDLDGDGKPDIASANDGTRSLSVLINQNGSETGMCANGNKTLYANLVGTAYQWQMDSGNGFVNLGPGPSFFGVTTNGLQITGAPATWSGYRFRCVVNGVAGKITTLRFINQWTGAVSPAWENAGNWSCGAVPDVNTDAVISSGTIVVNANVTVRTLKLEPEVVVTVGTGVTLTVTH